MHRAYRKRIAAEGLLRTGWYYFGTHLLPRIGIQIKYLYEHDPNSIFPEEKIPKGVSIDYVSNMSNLESSDIKTLHDFEGHELIQRVEREFANGNQSIVVRKEFNGLVGFGWISQAPLHLLSGNAETYLIRDVFVMPGMRGQSLYPYELRKACSHILASVPNSKPRILVASMFTNRSSIRGIIKAGFHRVGTVIVFYRWKLVSFKTENGNVFRVC